MRRIYKSLILSSLMVIGGIATCGLYMEKNYRQSHKKLEEQWSIPIDELNYKRGWLCSEARVRSQALDLLIEDTLYHFPGFWKNGYLGRDLTQIAIIESKVSKLSSGEAYGHGRSKISALGEMRSHAELKGWPAIPQGLIFDAQGRADLDSFDYQISLPLIEKASHSFHFNARQFQSAGSTWTTLQNRQSKSQSTLERLELYSDYVGPKFELKRLDFSSELAKDYLSEHISGGVEGHVDTLFIDQYHLGSLRYQLRIANCPLKAMRDLSYRNRDMDLSSLFEGLNFFKEMFRAGAQVNFDLIRIENPLGPIIMNASLNFKQFDLNDKQLGPMEQLVELSSHFKMAVTAHIPGALIEEFLQEFIGPWQSMAPPHKKLPNVQKHRVGQDETLPNSWTEAAVLAGFISLEEGDLYKLQFTFEDNDFDFN